MIFAAAHAMSADSEALNDVLNEHWNGPSNE